MRQADERGANTEEEDEKFDDDIRTKSDKDSPQTRCLCLYLVNICLTFSILCIYISML